MGESLSWLPRLVRKSAPEVNVDIISMKKSHTAVGLQRGNGINTRNYSIKTSLSHEYHSVNLIVGM